MIIWVVAVTAYAQRRKRAREYGINIGVMKPGVLNAITDVKGVKVGHTTQNHDNVHPGVTAILPHDGNLFQTKVPAAVIIGNDLVSSREPRR